MQIARQTHRNPVASVFSGTAGLLSARKMGKRMPGQGAICRKWNFSSKRCGKLPTGFFWFLGKECPCAHRKRAMGVECSQFAKKLAATTSHREGAYSRTGEPSATFYERGGAAAGARSNMAKVAEMNISFRAIKISQSTKVNCDIGNGSLPLAEKEGSGN